MDERQERALIRLACAPVDRSVLREAIRRLDALGIEYDSDEAILPAKFADYLKSDAPEGLEALFSRLAVSVITKQSNKYPEALHHLEDRPEVVFCRGTVGFGRRRCAIIGARKATQYGLRVARELARTLAAQGVTIISGMARGIDQAAHQGALEAQGKTIAVLGSGVDVVYPPESTELYDKICETGLVISEYPPGTPPFSRHFPERNRLIAALAEVTIVVEATQRSGVWHTVKFAQELGREVMAVPGNITSAQSMLPNLLISEGARPVLSAQDIMEEMGWEALPEAEEEPQKPALSLEEEIIVSLISREPMPADLLSAKMDMPIDKLNSHLTRLEIRGIIKRPQGRICLS